MVSLHKTDKRGVEPFLELRKTCERGFCEFRYTNTARNIYRNTGVFYFRSIGGRCLFGDDDIGVVYGF